MLHDLDNQPRKSKQDSDGQCPYSKSKIAIFFQNRKKLKSRFYARSDHGKYSAIMCNEKRVIAITLHPPIGCCTN